MTVKRLWTLNATLSSAQAWVALRSDALERIIHPARAPEHLPSSDGAVGLILAVVGGAYCAADCVVPEVTITLRPMAERAFNEFREDRPCGGALEPAGSVKLADSAPRSGFPAFAAVLGIFWLMIAKPSLAII
jgi:hypothetical protein